MVVLLVSGSLGFALLATGEAVLFVVGVFAAFALGWGWPGLFNLAVVDLNREAPGAATGVTQTGIYVGAAAGPAAYGLVSEEYGYSTAWVVSGRAVPAGCAGVLLRGTAGTQPDTGVEMQRARMPWSGSSPIAEAGSGEPTMCRKPASAASIWAGPGHAEAKRSH